MNDPINLLARELAVLDVEPGRVEVIRAKAHVELGRKASPWRGLYRRVEMGAAGLLTVAYLVWAVQSILIR